MTVTLTPSDQLELWAGIECSVVRIGDRFVNQLELTGHAKPTRINDLDKLAALGIRALRYPVLWEEVQPDPKKAPDFRFTDERLLRIRDLGITPIVGLVHHGSGPRHTNLLEESFVTGLSEFARCVAERYPWVVDYTPVNEPLTTARFSALYGHWYPHAKSAKDFIRALVIQCRAIRSAMKAIREIVPNARLIQTEDLATIFSTPKLAYQAAFENQRRFASLDLLCGQFGLRDAAALRGYFEENGDKRDLEAIQSFAAEPCPPDIIGVNHYVTSDRFLDERVDLYPRHVCGGNGVDTYADVEAVRVRPEGIPGHRALLRTLWSRYELPLAITEVHLGCSSEEQIRWLNHAWTSSLEARSLDGIDVRAVTVWSAFGASDWDSLLTNPRGHYEPGMFDAGTTSNGALHDIVRPTAVASVARDLAKHGRTDHPLANDPGWWARPNRILYHQRDNQTVLDAVVNGARPLLILGAGGTLGRALVRVAGDRDLAFVALTRAQLDVSDARAIRSVLDVHQPWAVINAAGFVRVDDAEQADAAHACLRVNGEAPAILAEECARRGIRILTYSSDLVFDGKKGTPYVEEDPPNPLNVYGASKTLAEQLVLQANPSAIVARTSAFFGPWDTANFVHHALTQLRSGQRFRAAADVVISPTYVPDLAHASITLLVDGAHGIWHLASSDAELSWFELAQRAAQIANIGANVECELLIPCAFEDFGLPAKRPLRSALSSTRGRLLRPLDVCLSELAQME